jgi:iron complex outermembrane recepter protein
VFGDVAMVEGLTLFGSIQNLFDAHWYANSYHPLWVQPSAPRTATIGLRASF